MNRLIVLVDTQVVAQELIEVAIEASLGHHAAVLHFQCSGSCISRIGHQCFSLSFPLGVDFFKFLQGKKNLPTNFKALGNRGVGEA